MLSVAVASREGRRVAKAPEDMLEKLVEDGEFGRSEPGPASLGDLSNDE
ncbi:MAG: hypothetical protein QOJ06_525, partial [Pseudonocardiales bacterium]|nr:hypothetical protein [Pseudonocardiales bacterium]